MAPGSGDGDIVGYTTGDAIGVSATGVFSPYSTAIALTVGAGDADIPAALDEAAITVTTVLGGALIQIAMGDDVTAYLETAACLDQGTHYIWIEPQNADGLPGAVSGPYTINII